MNFNLKNSSALFGLFFLALPLASMAQKDTLGNEQVNVVKAYEPTLSDAYKISEVPDKDTLTPSSPAFDYQVTPKKLSSSFDVTPVKPIKLGDEVLTGEERNFVKGGFGNYLTTYGEGFFKLNKDSKTHIMGLYLKHLSSQGDLKNAGFPGLSDNEAGFFSKRFMKKSVLTADFTFSREVVHFYGFTPDSATPSAKETLQRFYKYGEDIRWASVNPDAGSIKYDVGMKYMMLSELPYYYLGTKYALTEKNFIVDATASMPIGKLNYGITTTVDYNHDNNLVTKSGQAIIILDPKVTKQGKFWRVTTGTNLVFQPVKNAAGNTKWNPNIFSDIDFSLNFFDNVFLMYGGIGGGIIKNNFMNLSEENPFLSSQAPLLYSYNNLDLKLGARGAITRSTSWNVFADLSKIDNMPFFVNDWNPYFADKNVMNKFNIIYDDKVEVFNLHAEVAHVFSPKLSSVFKGDYFHYSTDLEHPWQKPSVELLASAKYEIGSLKAIKFLEKGKWFVRGDVYYEGTRYAKFTVIDPVESYTFSSVKLKPYADISAAIDYKHTDRLSFFLKLNNMASMRYERWMNYPSQRLNVMAGLGYIF